MENISVVYMKVFNKLIVVGTHYITRHAMHRP